MTVAENIKKIRKERNLTQKELGDLLHVSNKTISKWESNRSLPDVDTIKNIARVFDVDYKIIIDGDLLDKDEVDSIRPNSIGPIWISILYIFLLVVMNYLFGKIFVIYDINYIFLFTMIVISSFTLLAICKSSKYSRSTQGIVYLSVSALNVFLLTTTVFTTEELYFDLIFKLAMYWLIISVISYFVFSKLKTKTPFIILYSIYLIMKLFIPFIVLWGIGMSSYGNI